MKKVHIKTMTTAKLYSLLALLCASTAQKANKSVREQEWNTWNTKIKQKVEDRLKEDLRHKEKRLWAAAVAEALDVETNMAADRFLISQKLCGAARSFFL